MAASGFFAEDGPFQVIFNHFLTNFGRYLGHQFADVRFWLLQRFGLTTVSVTPHRNLIALNYMIFVAPKRKILRPGDFHSKHQRCTRGKLRCLAGTTIFLKIMKCMKYSLNKQNAKIYSYFCDFFIKEVWKLDHLVHNIEQNIHTSSIHSPHANYFAITIWCPSSNPCFYSIQNFHFKLLNKCIFCFLIQGFKTEAGWKQKTISITVNFPSIFFFVFVSFFCN